MKKYNGIFMAFVLSLGILAGCGSDNHASTSSGSENQMSELLMGRFQELIIQRYLQWTLTIGEPTTA